MKQAFIQNRIRISLLTLAVVMAVLLSLVLAKPTHAQEINPLADSYSYGSTSEFSPYATLGQGTNGGGSSGSLASTGQSVAVGFAAVTTLLLLAGASVYLASKTRRKSVK